MKLNDITINQYNQILELEAKEKPSAIRGYKKLAIAFNTTYEKVLEMDTNKINFHLANLNKPENVKLNKYIILNGWIYKATTNLIDMKPIQLLDFISLSGNETKLNDLLAVMYVPLFGKYKAKNHAKVSKAIGKTKVKKTLGLLFFWEVYSKKCEKRMVTYLEKQMQTIAELMKEIQTDKEFQTFYQTTAGNIT